MSSLLRHNIPQKIVNYLRLIRFDKPVGTILLMWPTLWGLWVANNGQPNNKVLFVFMLGVFLMRSVGCIINDMADRNFDGGVVRTNSRPLVTKNIHEVVTIKEALFVLIVLSLIAFIFVVSLNNIALIYHSAIALMLTTLYPFCKRFFACPQFVLGLAFAYAIPMGYVASNIAFTNVTWLLYVLSVLHSIIYDSFYAMSDIMDDRKLGLKSSAVLLQDLYGDNDINILAVIQLVFLAVLVYIIYLLEFYFYEIVILTGLVAMMFCYQISLAKTRISSNFLKAFKNNNWVGLIIFFGFVFG